MEIEFNMQNIKRKYNIFFDKFNPPHPLTISPKGEGEDHLSPLAERDVTTVKE